MTNDIDLLMARVDEINRKSADELTSDDISVIIAYHRDQRARRATGEKPNRPKVDLSSILGNITIKPKATGFKGLKL